MQNNYELMVLLHPDLEIDVEAPIAKVESLVEAVGGKVIKRDNWGKKRLAYRIARQDFAIYVYFEIQLNPASVTRLESSILITEEILRHILVKHEESATRKNAKKADKLKSEVKADEGVADEAKAEE